LAGCENNILNVTAPDLARGWFGNYTMEFLDNYTQTFTKLNADTGTNKNYEVYWEADKGINYKGYYVDSVNHNSYTWRDGVAHTVFSAWKSTVGDKVTVSASYIDECGNKHIDNIKIKVKNVR